MHRGYRLHDSLGYQLTLASRIQQRRLEDGLRPFGLNRTAWAILVAVGIERLSQPSDIADFLGIDRTATSRALRKMEGAGLIARRGCEDDGRARQVALTDAGHDRLDHTIPVAERNAAVMAERLSPDERAQLASLLRKLIAGPDDRPTHL